MATETLAIRAKAPASVLLHQPLLVRVELANRGAASARTLDIARSLEQPRFTVVPLDRPETARTVTPRDLAVRLGHSEPPARDAREKLVPAGATHGASFDLAGMTGSLEAGRYRIEVSVETPGGALVADPIEVSVRPLRFERAIVRASEATGEGSTAFLAWAEEDALAFGVFGLEHASPTDGVVLVPGARGEPCLAVPEGPGRRNDTWLAWIAADRLECVLVDSAIAKERHAIALGLEGARLVSSPGQGLPTTVSVELVPEISSFATRVAGRFLVHAGKVLAPFAVDAQGLHAGPRAALPAAPDCVRATALQGEDVVAAAVPRPDGKRELLLWRWDEKGLRALGNAGELPGRVLDLLLVTGERPPVDTALIAEAILEGREPPPPPPPARAARLLALGVDPEDPLRVLVLEARIDGERASPSRPVPLALEEPLAAPRLRAASREWFVLDERGARTLVLEASGRALRVARGEDAFVELVFMPGGEPRLLRASPTRGLRLEVPGFNRS